MHSLSARALTERRTDVVIVAAGGPQRLLEGVPRIPSVTGFFEDSGGPCERDRLAVAWWSRCDFGQIDDLLPPPEVRDKKRAQELLAKLSTSDDELMATIRRFFDAHGELLDLAAHDQSCSTT